MQVKNRLVQNWESDMTKTVHCHPAYLTYMQSTSCKMLDEAQAGIKISAINNNLRYADDTTLLAESKEELKSLLMKVKEQSEKAGLKQHSKDQDHGIHSYHFMANRWGNNGKSDRLYFFLDSKITADGDCSHEIKRYLLLGRKVVTNLEKHIKKQRHYSAN